MQQPRVLTVFGLTFWVLLESLRRVHPRIRQCLHVPARWCEIETLATPHTGMARRFCGWATPCGTRSVPHSQVGRGPKDLVISTTRGGKVQISAFSRWSMPDLFPSFSGHGATTSHGCRMST